MDIVSKIAIGLFAAFILWNLFSYIRSNPQTLSWDNLNKSLFSMGVLGVVLIAFIALVVILLRRAA